MELARNLPKEVDLHILTTSWNGGTGETMATSPLPETCTVHLLSQRSDNFAYNLGFQYAVLRRFPSINRESKFDLVHCNHAHMSDLLLALRHDIPPVVRTIHSTISSQRGGTKAAGLGLSHLESSEKYTMALLPLLKTAERFCLRRTQAAIFVSEFIRDIVKDMHAVSASIEEVIGNGVDLDRFKSMNSEGARQRFDALSGLDCPIVLYSGRLLAMKGVYILIDAASRVLKEFPDMRFVFAGEGMSVRLREEISRFAIPQEKFIFLGKVEHSMMPSLYAAANICVLPSLVESCPMSLLEAMACERPVVATSVGDIPRMIRDQISGVLTSPGDTNGLASSILELLNDESMRRGISAGARKTVESDFSTQKMALRTFSIYQRLMEVSN